MPMDPLIEVSTDRGRNMRGTCARVLAAALLGGAIASVVGISAIFGTPGQTSRPFAATPSALQRTVRLTARPLRPRLQRRAAPVSSPQLQVPTRPRGVTRSLAVAHPVHRRARVAPLPPRPRAPPRRPLPASRPGPGAPPPVVAPPPAAAPVAPAPAEAAPP